MMTHAPAPTGFLVLCGPDGAREAFWSDTLTDLGDTLSECCDLWAPDEIAVYDLRCSRSMATPDTDDVIEALTATISAERWAEAAMADDPTPLPAWLQLSSRAAFHASVVIGESQAAGRADALARAAMREWTR